MSRRHRRHRRRRPSCPMHHPRCFPNRNQRWSGSIGRSSSNRLGTIPPFRWSWDPGTRGPRHPSPPIGEQERKIVDQSRGVFNEEWTNRNAALNGNGPIGVERIGISDTNLEARDESRGRHERSYKCDGLDHAGGIGRFQTRGSHVCVESSVLRRIDPSSSIVQ